MKKYSKKGYWLEFELKLRKIRNKNKKTNKLWEETCSLLGQLDKATSLLESGEIVQSRAALERLLAEEHGWLAHSSLLFCLLHDSRPEPSEVLSNHRQFGEQAERFWPLPARPHENLRDPERNLRIGFLSGDLRRHPVTSLVLPVLLSLQDKGLELYAYSSFPREDDVSKSISGLFKEWISIHGVDDDAAASRIRSDKIDILIDLSGHTAYNRLLLLARKPAPIQVSWIGYPGTTGLRAVDYYLLNKTYLETGNLQEQFIEKLVGLPDYLYFDWPVNAPAVSALPAQRNGQLTLASFNRMGKLSDASLILWQRVLTALPDASLVLGGVDAGRIPDIQRRCEAHGFDMQRVLLLERSSLPGYLMLHGEVDFLLDTYPYTGGTTTLYGLWMGVPTLTLQGQTLAGRQTAGILATLGLDDFIAVSEDDYIAKAVAWSRQIERLARIRGNLREQLIAQSQAVSGEIQANALLAALRRMWRCWCSSQPPEAF